MSKYESFLPNLKEQFSKSNKILIALPSKVSIDELAGGLAFFQSLKQTGKKVYIASEDTLLVAHSHLYGIGEVENSMPNAGGGNFVLTLENVVNPTDGLVTSLEKLDWFPDNSNLNLVFHVLPGQKFEPARIIPSYQGTGFDLILTIGASNLNELGGLYQSNVDKYANVPIINIDNANHNNQYGQINIVDSASSTISEIVLHLLQDLEFPLDNDSASNILTGIYDETKNLTNHLTPDTFITVGVAMQYGGKTPNTTINGTVENTQNNSSQVQSQGFDFKQFISQDPKMQPSVNTQAPREEKPVGEQAVTTSAESPEAAVNPAPDWLSPKVYKGKTLG